MPAGPFTAGDRSCRLRQSRKLGPAGLGPILGLPASTVHRILTRHGLNRLTHLDRPTGQLIRRYERERPGGLIDVDVKKLGRIPDGGGRLACSEIQPDEKAVTCAAFLCRAAASFATSGIDRIERV